MPFTMIILKVLESTMVCKRGFWMLILIKIKYFYSGSVIWQECVGWKLYVILLDELDLS